MFHKLLLSLAGLSLALTSSLTFADDPVHNIMLEYTMKAISQDKGTIETILKKVAEGTPDKVTDAMLLTAVTRARTAGLQLQLISERSGAFEGAKYVAGELSPPGLDALPGAKQEELLAKYRDLLAKEVALFKAADEQLQAILKTPAAARNYTALQATNDGLDATKKQAHSIFMPPKKPN